MTAEGAMTRDDGWISGTRVPTIYHIRLKAERNHRRDHSLNCIEERKKISTREERRRKKKTMQRLDLSKMNRWDWIWQARGSLAVDVGDAKE